MFEGRELPVGETLTPTGLTLMRVGWISISLGVMATPETEEVMTRGLTTISCVLTWTPVAPSVTKHGLQHTYHVVGAALQLFIYHANEKDCLAGQRCHINMYVLP